MSGITDEMIEAAARSLAVTPWDITPDDLKRVIRHQAERVLTAALAGRAVVDLPEPTARRERLDGHVDIWPIGGWSVTASPGGVSISYSRDGLGGGLGVVLAAPAGSPNGMTYAAMVPSLDPGKVRLVVGMEQADGTSDLWGGTVVLP